MSSRPTHDSISKPKQLSAGGVAAAGFAGGVEPVQVAMPTLVRNMTYIKAHDQNAGDNKSFAFKKLNQNQLDIPSKAAIILACNPWLPAVDLVGPRVPGTEGALLEQAYDYLQAGPVKTVFAYGTAEFQHFQRKVQRIQDTWGNREGGLDDFAKFLYDGANKSAVESSFRGLFKSIAETDPGMVGHGMATSSDWD